MHIYRAVGVCISQSHSPRQIGDAAMCLAVHKVAPSADGLSKHNTGQGRIGHAPEAELLYLGDYKSGKCSADHPAVYGKPA